MSATVETFEFQTEARQLLDLMVHSVYSNKDIFLRELISNASDALDKLRFEALKQPELMEADTELAVLIERDADARTLSVSDTGIGMSRDEVVELIGTIAKSGSEAFLKQLQQKQGEEVPPELIGQFGVGFYSTFIAADKVTLVTRRAGEDKATKWESSGDGTYTLEETERDTQGTTVTLHLKDTDDEDGMRDYTQEWAIREVVKKYSDFVAYPIQMDIERTEIERDDEGKPLEGAEEKKVVTLETLNSMKAIWLRPKNEVEDEEYNEFYKHISHDWSEPMWRIQAAIEGTLEYRLLLYVPSKAPFDLFSVQGRQKGVHLYVKRIFIMDDCKDLLPEYLRFLRGVVDSEDLSLNISREILQQNRQIQRMGKGIVGKVLSTLKEKSENDAEGYQTFWNEFGRVLKEGIFQDQENQEALLGLARFASTHENATHASLKEYIDRMPGDQDVIYYLCGENRAQVENSPHLEAFRAKGYEVLLLTEPVDEVWTSAVHEFEGKRFQSAGKGAVDLGSNEEKEKAEESLKEQEKDYAELLACLKEKLSDRVKEVRLSKRLTESAACIVSDTQDMTPQLEQMMRAMGQDMPVTKRILELNPSHPVLDKLRGIHAADAEDAALADYAELLHGQAVLAEGGALEDPGRFSKLVAELLVKAL